MTSYELSNINRKYFGLSQVNDAWAKTSLSDNIIAYFDKDKIVKILNYKYGYLEYDAEINTVNRKTILPKTLKGKEQHLTAARILRIKGSGIQFSGSFQGGGITVYDNKRDVIFINSYPEDGQISSYDDINNWVDKYINESPPDYFKWLENQLSSKRLNVKAKPGDIIAFPVSRYEYGFARILLVDFPKRLNFLGKSLLILPYSFVSKTVDIDFDALIKGPALKPIQINDSTIFYGEFPVVSYQEIGKEEIPLVEDKMSKYLTIPYSKTDLLQLNSKW